MTAAPAFDCALCRRHIGKRALHHCTDDGRVVCSRCLGTAAHAKLFRGCPEQWHDVLDHPSCFGSRAGIAAHLGLWPHDRR